MALSVNELMIGDWVYGLSHAPRKVQGLRDYNEENVVVADHWVNCKQLEPIPLTSEILEKNGFIKINSQRYRWGELCGSVLFHVDVNPKMGFFYVTNESHKNHANVYDCFYVHTLQHALRLCRLNGLADNFKV